MSVIKYQIMAFDKDNLGIVVRYFTNEVTPGLTYSLDLPIENMPKGKELENFILFHAPKAQLERMALLKKANNDTSEIEALVATSLTLPIQTLEDLKTVKKSMMHTQLERELANGVEYRGYRFNASRSSLAALSAVVTGIQSGQKLSSDFCWRNSINNNISFNEKQVVELHHLMVEHSQKSHEMMWKKKAEVDSAANSTVVASVNWRVRGDLA